MGTLPIDSSSLHQAINGLCHVETFPVTDSVSAAVCQPQSSLSTNTDSIFPDTSLAGESNITDSRLTVTTVHAAIGSSHPQVLLSPRDIVNGSCSPDSVLTAEMDAYSIYHRISGTEEIEDSMNSDVATLELVENCNALNLNKLGEQTVNHVSPRDEDIEHLVIQTNEAITSLSSTIAADHSNIATINIEETLRVYNGTLTSPDFNQSALRTLNGARPSPDISQSALRMCNGALLSPDISQSAQRTSNAALQSSDISQSALRTSNGALPSPDISQSALPSADISQSALRTSSGALPSPDISQSALPFPDISQSAVRTFNGALPSPDISQSEVRTCNGTITPPDISQSAVRTCNDTVPSPDSSQSAEFILLEEQPIKKGIDDV